MSALRRNSRQRHAQQGSSLLDCHGKPVVRDGYSSTLSDCQPSKNGVGSHPLTFTKLTPRSNAAKYRASGDDTDNTYRRRCSVTFQLQHTDPPDTSAPIPEIDSSWSVVKTRLGLNFTADHLTQNLI